jgi:AraC-like DNA-binding protein
MHTVKHFILDNRYGDLVRAYGVDASEALRKAHVPEDVFTRRNPTMTASEYYAFMQAVGELSPDPDLAVRMSTADGVEQFSPPVFAAYCSADGRTCVERLARYKKLIGPMEFIITEADETPDGLYQVEMTTVDAQDTMPSFLVQCEYSFLVSMLRNATKEDVRPVRATMQEPGSSPAFVELMGLAPERGPRNLIAFRPQDMELPFISRNDAMWNYFEPELARRLSELATDDSFAARVRSALIEMLPGGAGSADDVASALGVSRRTLQRRLGDEGTSFQAQLNHTRELLAKHYLGSTQMRTDEIAYLLGYTELNSFLRAFSAWCGMSPSEYRKSVR